MMAALGALLAAGCAVGREAPRASERAGVQAEAPIAVYPRMSALDVTSLREAGAPPFALSYTVDAPARVRLRIVDSECPGVILRTLLDWAERGTGRQTESWDGLDHKGDPVAPRGVSVVLDAEPALESGEPVLWDRDALLALRYPAEKHFTHERGGCRDLDVTLVSPSEGETLYGVVDVCAALGVARGIPSGEYHVVVYLDGRTAWDGRVPADTFCQAWDTRNIPDGTYRLAVTFNDLRDHAGSDWLHVTVANGD